MCDDDERRGMVYQSFQTRIEAGGNSIQFSIWPQPQQDDSCMCVLFGEYERSEANIVRDEHT